MDAFACTDSDFELIIIIIEYVFSFSPIRVSVSRLFLWNNFVICRLIGDKQSEDRVERQRFNCLRRRSGSISVVFSAPSSASFRSMFGSRARLFPLPLNAHGTTMAQYIN